MASYIPNNPYVPNVLGWSSPFSELKGRGFSANFVQTELENFVTRNPQKRQNEFSINFRFKQKTTKENAVDFTKMCDTVVDEWNVVVSVDECRASLPTFFAWG